MTVQQAAAKWLASRAGELSHNTIRSYRGNLNPVARFFGDRRLGSINNMSDIRLYRQSRRKKNGKLCANRTVNHEVDALSYLLGEANLWKKLAPHYKPLPEENASHSSRKPLTNEQFNRLVATALANPQWEHVVCAALLAVSTTCRPKEISNLRLGHIHVDGDYPHIAIVRSKTAASTREIPLNAVAPLAIRKLLTRASQLGSHEPQHFLLPADLSKHTKPSDPLYSRRFDGWDPALPQRTWYSTWRKLCAKAGLPGTQFYQLRHTAITAGHEQNIHASVIASLSGHTTTEMSDWYTSIRNDPKRKAVEALAQSNPVLLDLLGLLRDDDDAKPVN
jgi:integrase